jgi:hypothetical protein
MSRLGQARRGEARAEIRMGQEVSVADEVARVLEASLARAIRAARLMGKQLGLSEDEWAAAADLALWRIQQRREEFYE